MEFPKIIKWTSPFLFEGKLGSKFKFHSNLKSTFCAQAVKNLIKHHVLLHLIWFCTVCQCPLKRMLGLNGLNESVHVNQISVPKR